MHVLIAEDERKMATSLKRSLEQENHSVGIAFDGHDALEMAQGLEYDAIVLNVMLPGIDGLEVIRRLRKTGNKTPILALSARNTVSDVVKGLDLGAHDYISKPFHFEEFLARLRSVSRCAALQFPPIIKNFREARAREYREIIKDLTKLSTPSQHKRLRSHAKRLRSRFQEIVAVDFFHSPLQAHVEKLLKRAESDANRTSTAPVHGNLHARDYRQKLWVTRHRPGVDRCGSSWLIRRFIDPKARFGFADEAHVPPQGIAYDMYHGGFGHRGDDCTFETLAKEFRIRNRKVDIIAEIIHDADVLDDKFGRHEGFGINEVLKGWARRNISDNELLERGVELFEGLYESLT